MSDHLDEPPTGEPAEAGDLDQPGLARPVTWDRKTVLKVVFRFGIVVVAIGVSGFVLWGIFDDLDFEEIGDALRQLSDAEWLALGFGWLAWIAAQGLQTASLVAKLPVRRGVLAYLGPSAVASVIPGPSDLPLRFSMYQSWGISNNEAATVVAASGIFSVGSQLVLPALAGVLIAFGQVQVEGFLTIIVAATLVLAVTIVIAAFVLGRASRTQWAGEKLQRLWRFVRRVIRRPLTDDDPPLAEVLVEHRATSLGHLRDKWLVVTWATVLTQAAKCSLLIMSLRFVGIPEDILGWTAIFVVYTLVAGLTVIPITPGSAGVAEVALVGMLTPIAGSEFVNEVAAGVLLYRLLTWILIIPAGLGALAVWRHGTRRAAA